MTRVLLAIFLFATLAAAEGRARLTEEQQVRLVRTIGPRWGDLPDWRQRMLVGRYAQYLAFPAAKRERIDAKGLREYLLKPERRVDMRQLPAGLREEIAALPSGSRAMAAKIAVVRLRQLRLDRGLSYLPRDQRWPMFDRLFPARFDAAAVRAAHGEFKKRVAKHFAERVRRKAAEKPGFDERRMQEFTRRMIEAEEKRLVQRIRRELFRSKRGPDGIRRHGYQILERLRFVTPRQQELIRYAFRPSECPLLDLRFLGPEPEDPAERRVWRSDYTTLGRLDLLTKAGLPTEIVLHLAGTGSPEDFWRAVKTLQRLPK